MELILKIHYNNLSQYCISLIFKPMEAIFISKTHDKHYKLIANTIYKVIHDKHYLSNAIK